MVKIMPITDSEGKHITFDLQHQLPHEKRKTAIWQVTSKKFGWSVGCIRWLGNWRRYAFFPDADTAFEEDCLRDIAKFCETVTKAHWAELRLKKQARKAA